MQRWREALEMGVPQDFATRGKLVFALTTVRLHFPSL